MCQHYRWLIPGQPSFLVPLRNRHSLFLEVWQELRLEVWRPTIPVTLVTPIAHTYPIPRNVLAFVSMRSELKLAPAKETFSRNPFVYHALPHHATRNEYCAAPGS